MTSKNYTHPVSKRKPLIPDGRPTRWRRRLRSNLLSPTLFTTCIFLLTTQAFAAGTRLKIDWMGGGMWAQSAVAQSPDGQYLAASSGSGDNNIKLWRISDGSLFRTIGGDLGGVNDIAYSPDGQFIASAAGVVFGYEDASVKVWRVNDGKVVLKLPTSYEEAWSIAISPDGTLLAAGLNGEVIIWRMSDGTKLKTLKGHNGYVFGVAFAG